MKINKNQLIKKFATINKISQALSNKMITSLFGIMMEEICKGNSVTLPMIGTLIHVLHKSKRMGDLHRKTIKIVPEKLRLKLRSSLLLDNNMAILHNQQMIENTSFFK